MSESDFIRETYERMQAVSKGLPSTKSRRQFRKSKSGRERTVDTTDDGWNPGPGLAPKRYWNTPKSIKESLSTVVWKENWGENISLGTIVSKWPIIVGAAVALHSQVEAIETGKIYVRADSTAWAKQLQLLLPQIERRISEELGGAGDYNVVVSGPKPPSWKRGKFTVRGPGPRDTYG